MELFKVKTPRYKKEKGKHFPFKCVIVAKYEGGNAPKLSTNQDNSLLQFKARRSTMCRKDFNLGRKKENFFHISVKDEVKNNKERNRNHKHEKKKHLDVRKGRTDTLLL